MPLSNKNVFQVVCSVFDAFLYFVVRHETAYLKFIAPVCLLLPSNIAKLDRTLSPLNGLLLLHFKLNLLF